MSPEEFVAALAGLKLKYAFNPYSERCHVHDIENAPDLRRELLLKILTAAVDHEIDAIWIGRDLGYRGGRRTGLAFTDDLHVEAHAQRWQLAAQRTTFGAAFQERTAATIWATLDRIKLPIFLWNVFPLHPHQPENEFSNRPHTKSERYLGEELLAELVLMLRPRRLVAIGNDASKAARKINGDHVLAECRHPSYGGQKMFISQVNQLYSLPSRQPQLI